MYNVDFGKLQRYGIGPYYSALKDITKDYNEKLKTMPLDDIYRDQLVANLVMVEMEIEHIDKEEM